MLSCFNIEAKQVRGEFEGTPYNGIVYTMTDDTGKPVCTPIKSSLIGKRFGYEGLESVSDSMPVNTRTRNGSPRYGTVSHSPCTAAGATGRTSSACSTGRE